MLKEQSTWYASWFDTPFYHTLYKDRDYEEAELFMSNITQHLSLPEQSRILDLACGKGRHSIFLNRLGYNVTGVDLSENSIAHAKQFENETLEFKVHDMCQPFGSTFDAVFNLFTSFGYFEDDENNINTIKSIKANLNNYGFGVIDFMNSEYVIDNLVDENTKTVDGIDFLLKRRLENGYIFKDISFMHEGEAYHFEERVRAFTLDDFKLLFKKADVDLLEVYGDYNLNRFNSKTSERLILIFK
ncbi:class I SAM-dependent methyltransferase [Ichthyenterobacterium sp. W332]|uniref:Class I SAM-dependent methyltransferase n=1 Tax=Microcosmobacter mediterraneus TaxID=3075607 RepID=A0ABU2YGX4_9FLAO|nr:class I SAM-dependent methyltransferase [Ichthyenterobacterium sp. W332]MDT0557420.1 class I SAM-dependent methyltransferase [Ichthyenterobacterium sp. W332]